MIVAVLSDILFSSKIRTAAETSNETLKVARNETQLDEFLKEAPSLVIVDLNGRGCDPFLALKKAQQSATPRLIAYLSHVDTELADRAEKQGVTEIFSRSQFVKELPLLLRNGAATF